MEIKLADEKDITALDPENGAFAQRLRSGTVFLAAIEGQIAGCVLLEYSFFAQGFISYLHVYPDYRRKGIGSLLVLQVESICKTEKLFTSTNESNLPMQAFMAKLRYVPSGVINNLDEGDPEIVFFKRLEKSR